MFQALQCHALRALPSNSLGPGKMSKLWAAFQLQEVLRTGVCGEEVPAVILLGLLLLMYVGCEHPHPLPSPSQVGA